MTSTLSCTNSEARVGRRLRSPSAYRYSNEIFFPSTYPSSLRPWWRPSALFEDGDPELRMPIRGIFLDCCASAERQTAKSTAQSARPKMLLPTPDHCLLTILIESP